MAYKYYLIFNDFEKIAQDERPIFSSEKTVNNDLITVYLSNTKNMNTLQIKSKMLIEYNGYYLECKDEVIKSIDNKYLTIIAENRLILGVLQDD